MEAFLPADESGALRFASKPRRRRSARWRRPDTGRPPPRLELNLAGRPVPRLARGAGRAASYRWRIAERGDAWSDAASATACSPLLVFTKPPLAAVSPPVGTYRSS